MGTESAGGWRDVSRPLREGIPVWPGDHPLALHRRREDGLVISWLETTCHVGTHVDAPLHVVEGGASVEEIPLQRFLGPVEVVDAASAGDRIRPRDLPPRWRPGAPRVFFRTGACPPGAAVFPGRFPGLDVELVELLARSGVVLVGLDTPSVDPPDDPELRAHLALAREGITWIEGLDLARAGPGMWEMVGLPLPLAGAEAAPVRVLVRPLEDLATRPGKTAGR